MLRKSLTTFLALVIVLSFCIPVDITHASGTFHNENIALYLIGKTALVRYNFTGTEIGFTGLANLEQDFPDVSYYKLYVGQFKVWPTEYLYFSNLGQDLILSEYASSDGAFLYVAAGSIDSAQRFASALGNLTSLSFIPLATPHSDVFVFSSPSTFSQVAPGFLQALVPTAAGGFASLVSISELVLENSPQITLIGKKAADGFTRSVIFDYFEDTSLLWKFHQRRTDNIRQVKD